MSRPRTVSMVEGTDAAPVDKTAISGIVVTEGADGTKISSVVAHQFIGAKEPGATQEIKYTGTKVVGNGSFGVVFLARLLEEEGEGRQVAIKKVLQDRRFKNRELQTMQLLNHCNVVSMFYYFFSDGTKNDEVYLNLVLEYVPQTLYQVIREHSKQRTHLPVFDVKLYAFQMFRALAYVHSLGLCHRDVKPQNLLLDPSTKVLKLCDFGSAKRLVAGQPNVAYICSRYYRAPELIFGAMDYTSRIDVWSAGCVLAEMLLGQPLFPGESGVDQLVEIIKVLGTPTRAEVKAMNPNYTEFKFPQIKAHPWHKVFPASTPEVVVDLVATLLQYIPSNRASMMRALSHRAFDELRSTPKSVMLPPLFNFTEQELTDAGDLRDTILR